MGRPKLTPEQRAAAILRRREKNRLYSRTRRKKDPKGCNAAQKRSYHKLRHYKTLRQAARCASCGEPTKDTYCSNCRARNNSNRRNRYFERRINRLCVRCPEVAEPGKSLCIDCLTRKAESQAKYYHGTKKR